jgi:hypothetical protein
VSARFTVYRVWNINAPKSESGSPTYILNQVAHGERIKWVGLDLAITNTSSSNSPEAGGLIWLGTAPGPGVPVLFVFVNGQDLAPPAPPWTLLDELVYIEGVPGCPFPFSGGTIAAGATTMGCSAVAVPTGATVSEVGFAFGPVEGGSAERFAQWRA